MGLGIAICLNDSPDDTVASAASVEVFEQIGQATSFKLEYNIDIDSGDFPLLKEPKLGPGSMISVIVPTTDQTYCLVKGPVYGQQIHLAQGGSGSTLEVHCADTSITLDREDKVVQWSDLTDSDAVTTILGQNNLTPDVSSTSAGHYETKHTLIQRETDLGFIRRLARRNGYFFWITTDETGTQTAHFKQPVVAGDAACELVINLTDPKSNVLSLDISWDVERPTSADASELDLNAKSVISGAVARSPLATLGDTALADIVTDSRVVHIAVPVDDSGDLQSRSESALIDAGFFVRASGTTTLSALGKVMQSHTLVNLRGAGSRHSGLWYCSSVKHTINPSEHRMDFELIRNGWNS
jgi:phage protein D